MPAAGRLRRWLPALTLVALISACGGGGGDGAEPEAPPVLEPPPKGVRVSAATPVAPGCDGGRPTGTIYVDAEVEPFAAVSPVNADHLVAMWQQDRTSNGGARALMSAVSHDGGLSWQRSMLPMSRCGGAAPGSAGDHERATDPWVDFGIDGSVYAMGLAFSGDALSPGSSSEMLVSRSLDGGLSWGAPLSLQRDGELGFNDKNTLTADPTDARFVYAVWDRLEASGYGPTLLARSSDAGAHWEPARVIYAPTVVGGVSQTIGNRIVVLGAGPDRGTLINVFTQIDSVGGTSAATLRVMRSSDHGASWSTPEVVADLRAVGARDPDTGVAIRDGSILPSIAAGADGVLWLAWQDARFSGGLRDAIALSRSSDGGRHWSAPVAVNRDASVPAFTPTLRVLADGRLGLMHFDLRSNTADRATLLADLWLLSTRDGVTWTETALARAVDLAWAPLASGSPFVGDYQGLVASGSSFVAVVGLPGSGSANRSDIHALRSTPPALASQALQADSGHRARATQSSTGGLDSAAFSRARSDAIRRAMTARLPGWSARVDAAAGAEAPR